MSPPAGSKVRKYLKLYLQHPYVFFLWLLIKRRNSFCCLSVCCLERYRYANLLGSPVYCARIVLSFDAVIFFGIEIDAKGSKVIIFGCYLPVEPVLIRRLNQVNTTCSAMNLYSIWLTSSTLILYFLPCGVYLKNGIISIVCPFYVFFFVTVNRHVTK
jgi:hypothetical protein